MFVKIKITESHSIKPTLCCYTDCHSNVTAGNVGLQQGRDHLTYSNKGEGAGVIKKHHEAVPLINVSYGQFSLLKRAVGSMYLAGHSAVPCKNTQQETE